MGRDDSARLGLLDLILLVGGCAVGMAESLRVEPWLHFGVNNFFGLLNWAAGPWDAWFVLGKAQGGLAGVALLFGSWTFVLLVIGYRRPRSLRRRLFRGPGLTACLAVSAVIGFGVVAMILAVGVQHWSLNSSWTSPFDPWFVGRNVTTLFATVGAGVAATWFVQAATGSWRAQANAIDRLGRAVGLMWLATGTVFAASLFLM